MAQPDGSLVFDTKIITDGFKKGTLALGASVTALAGTVVKLGADFEATAAKASTLFGQVAVDTANLNKKILEISSSTGLAATELNEALYSALSAGIPVTEDMAKATGFLESAAKLAKAGFTDTETAISATAKTLNAYKLDVSEAERIQGILIQTQNKGITTVNELGASLAQVTPTAAAFSVSFENVGAALATMTAQGTPTAQATTQLNQLIAELGKNGTTAAKNLKAAAQGTSFAGKSFKDMMESGASLSDILMLIQKQADINGVSMVDMFSSIEAGKSALAIVSGNAQTFNSNLEAMNDTAGLVEEGYEKMMNTLEGQTDKFIQSAKNLGIGFYEGIKEPLTEAVKAGNDSLSELQEAVANGELKSALTNAGTLIGKFVSVLIKLATSVIPPLINALGFLGDNIEFVTKAALAGVAAWKLWKMSAIVTTAIKGIVASFQTANVQLALFTLQNGKAALSSTTLTAALTAKELVVGVLTGKISLLTAAQTLLNKAWAANPVGVVVGGVTALVAGLALLNKAIDDSCVISNMLSAEIEGLANKARNAREEFDSFSKTQEKNIESSESEFIQLQKLADELRVITDESGNVTDANKAQAEFILNELNEALGTEYTMLGNQIQQYQELAESIDILIMKKRAEAKLDYMNEAYKKANGEIEAQKELVKELSDQLAIAQEMEPYKGLEGKAAVEEAQTALKDAQALLKEYQEDIEDFNAAWIAVELGDYDALFDGTYKNYKGASDGMTSALEEGKASVDETVDAINKKISFVIPNTTDALSALPTVINSAFGTSIESAKILGENLVLNFQNGAKKIIPNIVSAAENDGQLIVDALALAKELAPQLGTDYIQGVINGINERSGELWTTAFNAAQNITAGAKAGVRSNSPAKDGIDLGTDYVLGVEIGLEDEAPELNKTAKETAQDMNKSFAASLSHGMNTIRSEIASITGLIKEEAEKNVKAFDAELKKIEMLRDFGIDDEETYYRKLEFLRDNYLTKNSDKWIDITQELYDYQEAQLEEHRDNIEDVYDDIADHITDKLDEVAKKQQKFSDSLTDSTELFQKYTIDGVVHYKLNDFSSENVNLAAYQQWLSKAMERVKSSGASDDAISGVLDYIDGLTGDESGMDALIALASASDADFAKFMSGYAQNLSRADGIAAQRYSDDMVTAAEESYQQMVDELAKAGLDIPEGFFVSGTLSAEQFGEAFLSEIELQMQEIRRKLTEFNAEINASIGAAAGNVTNDNRSTTYHIYGDNSGNTVKQIQNMETIKRLSGQ